MASSGTTWANWSGLAEARPTSVLTPSDTGEVVDAVVAARRQGLTVKMVGSGHSFTDIAVGNGLLLRPDRLSGVTAVDRDAMTVTVLAGTPLHVLNARLSGLGLGLHNMGDIDRQTVAGAISTGTHGSGGRWASLSSQVAALQLVTGDGSVLTITQEQDPDLFSAAKVGLGALGILTEVTFLVEPEFRLTATETPMSWQDLVNVFDQLVEEHHHVDVHWFPRTDRALVKRNDRTLDEARPLSRVRAFLDDDLLENKVFGLMQRVGNVAPRSIPTMNRLAARALTGRSYTDIAPEVFVADRRVRFREMEYAVPREAGMAALVEARRLIDRSDWPISFPVEVRAAPADDSWLSGSYNRASTYRAFHVNARTDHRAYFGAVERVLREHGGRPHWGKLHTRTAADLAPDFPRWTDFAAVRDRVDPDRLFTNGYLDRVLGP
ncbi:MAG: D-arabinono-1,4-lactone oxidase [Nocardioides sp.]